MPAFQLPFITKLHACRLLCLPYRYTCPTAQNNYITCRRSFRCAFDGLDDASAVSDTLSYELLSDATIVTVQLPLDVYLEEANDGRVFIDELIPGGSAEASGLLHEGDIIVAVSLPFGEALFPVPKAAGLDMISSYVESTDGDTFSLAIVRAEGVEELRSRMADSNHKSISTEIMQNLIEQIHAPEYPFVPQDKDNASTSDTNFAPDYEALREYGIDIQDILNSPDHET